MGNSSRIEKAVEIVMREQAVTAAPPNITTVYSAKSTSLNQDTNAHPTWSGPAVLAVGRSTSVDDIDMVVPKTLDPIEPASSDKSDDSFENLPLADELPVSGLPPSMICPKSMMATEARQTKDPVLKLKRDSAPPGNNTRVVQLCAPCATFFEGFI